MPYVFNFFWAKADISVSVVDTDVVTNLMIERLVARDCYLASRDAGKRILLVYYFLHLQDKNG